MPDGTSLEYAGALLCQGLRTPALRRLLAGGSARALDCHAKARLWVQLAEACLLRGEDPACAARALRRAAALSAGPMPKEAPAPAASSAACAGAAESATLFASFQDREVA